MVTPTTANKRKRQATEGERMCTLMSPCEVPANESSVLVGGLDPGTSYSVAVMAVNSENEDGPTSAPVIATRKISRVIVVLCMPDKLISSSYISFYSSTSLTPWDHHWSHCCCGGDCADYCRFNNYLFVVLVSYILNNILVFCWHVALSS